MPTYEITLKSGEKQSIEAERVSTLRGWITFYQVDEEDKGVEVHRVAESEVASYGLKSAQTPKAGPAIA